MHFALKVKVLKRPQIYLTRQKLGVPLFVEGWKWDMWLVLVQMTKEITHYFEITTLYTLYFVHWP